jgi:C_GCAxxG_C_C family probable redox protein
MSDESLRMMELSLEGFGCSQITMILGLEAQGKSNPDLVRAISGLHGGLGFSGKLCGALSGCCCLLALYAGRGASEETEDTRLPLMIQSLVEWFEQEYKSQYGGIDCSVILQGDSRNQIARCPTIVADTFDKVKEILAENNIDFNQAPHSTA